MIVHQNPLFSIYFGNASDQLKVEEFMQYPAGIRLLAIEPFKKLKKLLRLEKLTFLKQVHGNRGYFLDAQSHSDPFKQEGDFIITTQKKMGIGVMTADCLPLIFYDNVHQVVAIAHAGWKGSVAQIAPTVVKQLQAEFNTDINQLRIFFGPSAKSCCYKVDEPFLEHLESFAFADQVIYKEEQGLMFDLPLFNKLQLEDMGIAKQALKLDYNFCTICDPKYCSYRREGALGLRQMTVVSLK